MKLATFTHNGNDAHRRRRRRRDRRPRGRGARAAARHGRVSRRRRRRARRGRARAAGGTRRAPARRRAARGAGAAAAEVPRHRPQLRRPHRASAACERRQFPVFFNKQTTCVTGPFDPIQLPRVSTLARLRRRARLRDRPALPPRAARRARTRSSPATSSCNDVSVRDWQSAAPTMTLGKSFDTHGPIGPWLVTPDEIGDPHALELRTWVNGELRQDSNTRELIFDCFAQVETCRPRSRSSPATSSRPARRAASAARMSRRASSCRRRRPHRDRAHRRDREPRRSRSRRKGARSRAAPASAPSSPRASAARPPTSWRTSCSARRATRRCCAGTETVLGARGRLRGLRAHLPHLRRRAPPHRHRPCPASRAAAARGRHRPRRVHFADSATCLYTYARLKGDGIEPYWCINHGPTTSLYYKDPDGNQIELQVDNFPTPRRRTAGCAAARSPPIRSASCSIPTISSSATAPASRSGGSRRGRPCPRAPRRSTCCAFEARK